VRSAARGAAAHCAVPRVSRGARAVRAQAACRALAAQGAQRRVRRAAAASRAAARAGGDEMARPSEAGKRRRPSLYVATHELLLGSGSLSYSSTSSTLSTPSTPSTASPELKKRSGLAIALGLTQASSPRGAGDEALLDLMPSPAASSAGRSGSPPASPRSAGHSGSPLASPRSGVSASAPARSPLRLAASQRSLFADSHRDFEQVRFHACKHCQRVFSGSEQAHEEEPHRHLFCSGECYITRFSIMRAAQAQAVQVQQQLELLQAQQQQQQQELLLQAEQ
jgi:hypothetical protein